MACSLELPRTGLLDKFGLDRDPGTTFGHKLIARVVPAGASLA